MSLSPLVFALTIAAPLGAHVAGRYTVDSAAGTSPSTDARIGDTAGSVASRLIMPLEDAVEVKASVAALIADIDDGVSGRQKVRAAGSVEVIETVDGGIIEVRSSPSQAAFIDPASTSDVADFDGILDGIIAG